MVLPTSSAWHASLRFKINKAPSNVQRDTKVMSSCLKSVAECGYEIELRYRDVPLSILLYMK